LNKFDYIFFDLDGTLTDPKEGIINSYIHAVNKLGLIENDKECITHYFGAPLHQYFTDKHSLKDTELEEAIALYREYYSQKGLYENFLYPGITELLDRLNLSGRTIYLVTVKPVHFAKIILEHFDILKYFYGVYGSDLTTYNKTKEELISSLLVNENVNCESCVMVGDRHHDVLGAKHNNVTSISVTYGYGDENELKECKPDFMVNSVSELAKHLL
jgi:phosphoglycolate phosphatase